MSTPENLPGDREDRFYALATALTPNTVAGQLAGSYARQVLRFMVAFDQLPRRVDELAPLEDIDLGRKLIVEECVNELLPALAKFREAQSLENLTEVVDGAVDTLYVVCWLLLKLNVPVDACFAEVQRSNMAKLNPDGSYTKNEFGKVQKPLGWTPPYLYAILTKHYDTAVWKNGLRSHDAQK